MKWRGRLLALAVSALCLLLAGCGKQELDAEPERWQLNDFESCFETQFHTEKEEYLLLEGTPEENTVQILRGEEDGPAVYIVAGVHGDERAGWLAGNLLKQGTLKAGTLYILSPANTYGAQQDRRRTKSGRDLNRNFPGNSEGWDAERIAASIYADIQAVQPELVLDLHEAIAKEDDYEALGANYDALGNSLICQSLDRTGELVLDALIRGGGVVFRPPCPVRLASDGKLEPSGDGNVGYPGHYRGNAACRAAGAAGTKPVGTGGVCAEILWDAVSQPTGIK